MTMPDGGQSTCSYNPTYNSEVVDKAQDCTNAAEWHIRISGAGPVLDGFFSTCAEHAPQAFSLDAGDGRRQFHEYGPGCGMPDGYWHPGINTCTTLDTALVAGIFWYECKDELPDPTGLALGAYARLNEQWYRVSEVLGLERPMWTGSKPPPGWTPGETHTLPLPGTS